MMPRPWNALSNELNSAAPIIVHREMSAIRNPRLKWGGLVLRHSSDNTNEAAKRPSGAYQDGAICVRGEQDQFEHATKQRVRKRDFDSSSLAEGMEGIEDIACMPSTSSPFPFMAPVSTTGFVPLAAPQHPSRTIPHPLHQAAGEALRRTKSKYC